MMTVALSSADRTKLLRFAASFLWADLEVAPAERRFLTELAAELAIDDAPSELAALFERPPRPEDIDPTRVHPTMADAVRFTALRAIAADGRVSGPEMAMFEVLDELLPDPAFVDAPLVERTSEAA